MDTIITVPGAYGEPSNQSNQPAEQHAFGKNAATKHTVVTMPQGAVISMNTQENYFSNPFVMEAKNTFCCCGCNTRTGTMALGGAMIVIGVLHYSIHWLVPTLNAMCGILMIVGAANYHFCMVRGAQIFLLLRCLAWVGLDVWFWVLYATCGDDDNDTSETDATIDMDFSCFVIFAAVFALALLAFDMWCFIVVTRLAWAYQRAKQSGASPPENASCA
jgi:hypothetical protein